MLFRIYLSINIKHGMQRRKQLPDPCKCKSEFETALGGMRVRACQQRHVLPDGWARRDGWPWGTLVCDYQVMRTRLGYYRSYDR